jgi:hypothetical protein
MRSAIILAALLLASPATSPVTSPARAAEVHNADRPMKGEWSFAPRLLWSVDQAAGQAFERPGELRVMEDGTSVFRDFGTSVSHIFTPDGRHVRAFAAQGDQPGQVPRYLNCFIAGNEIVIGAPSELYFFSRDGQLVASVPNNLFARFPIAFLGGRVALVAPGSLSMLPEGVARITRVDFSTGKESVFDELTIETAASGGGARGPVGVVRGLTPTAEAAWDRDLGRVYYGCSSDYKIRMARTDGESLGAFSLERPRQPVDEAAKRAHFEGSRIPAEHFEVMLAALPDKLASFRQVWAGAGLVYVLPSTGLERDVAAQPVDIFSSDGRYLYRAELRLPEDVRFTPDAMAIVGHDLYALCRDAQGRRSLRRFTISIPEGK